MIKTSSSFYIVFLTIFYVFAGGGSCVNAQFVVKKIPNKYKVQHTNQKTNSTNSMVMNKNVVDLTRYLPANYSTSGEIDYTEQIQKGLSENRNVKFPNFPILINDKGLTLSSNSNLYFGENSKIILKGSSKERYEILRMDNVQNITINNPVIEGDRNSHKGNTGEWGMGIAVRGGSKNISINNAQISNCWGDGVYLGHLRNEAPVDVTINSPIIDNCRRNGISITTGKDITVVHALISNIHGTAPQSGIVIEPSNSKAVFHNISVINPIIYNVYETGFKIAGFEKLLGNPNAVSNITIANPVTDLSQYGMFIGRIRDEKTVKGESLKGKIQIDNPVWLNTSVNSFIIRKQSKRGPTINVKGVKESVKKSGKLEAKEVILL